MKTFAKLNEYVRFLFKIIKYAFFNKNVVQTMVICTTPVQFNAL